MRHSPEDVDLILAGLLERWSSDAAPTEQVPLMAAMGRTLARDICADRDGPPFNRAAMDGLAIRFADWQAGARHFRSSGILAAGAPTPLPHGAFDAKGSGIGATIATVAAHEEQVVGLEIMTGAGVPKPYDMVIPYEELTSSGHFFEFSGSEDRKPFSAGSNIHPLGSDFRKGDTLLAGGSVVDSPSIAVLASVGCDMVPVKRRPRIAIISTGAELVSVSDKPKPHQIRASNIATLTAELNAWGLPTHYAEICTDNRAKLTDHLVMGMAKADIIVVVGAVSKGLSDYVPETLRTLGVRIEIHGVSQRPGKPLLIGHLPKGQSLERKGQTPEHKGQSPECNGQAFIGLPGNPVSCLVNLRRYLVPLLASRGESREIEIAGEVRAVDVNTRFVAVKLGNDVSRGVVVEGNGSGDFYHLATTDGFIQVPPREEGQPLTYPFYAWARS